MTWNARVMRKKIFVKALSREVISYGIHEVYYNKNGNVNSWTKDAMTLGNSESLDELKALHELWGKAFGKPILDYETGEEILEPHDGF